MTDEPKTTAQERWSQRPRAEEPAPDLIYDEPPADPTAIIATALATARAEGDTATAKKLEALLAHPAEAAALVARLAE